MKLISENKCFEGAQYVYEHQSNQTKTPMRFGLYLPPQARKIKVPVLYWLSGLTCSEQNFIIKSGMQRIASKLGIAVINPDTSPRGLNIPGEDDSYDFGSGAGFYVDATQPPWTQYRMYSYVAKELPKLVNTLEGLDASKVGLIGHSMGGHGAISVGLKNPEYFKSISAFAPICSPMHCPWGKKAFSNYLGNNENDWKQYDSCELIQSIVWKGPEILVDFGSADEYLDDQLMPWRLQQAFETQRVPLNLRIHEGYDHSFFFISTYLEEHFIHHLNILDKI